MATTTILNDEAVESTATMLRCVGHPVRLKILDVLEREGELTVTEIYEAVDIEQAVASQHLSLLHRRDVLERRREGIHVYYGIGDERIYKILECVREGCL